MTGKITPVYLGAVHHVYHDISTTPEGEYRKSYGNQLGKNRKLSLAILAQYHSEMLQQNGNPTQKMEDAHQLESEPLLPLRVIATQDAQSQTV